MSTLEVTVDVALKEVITTIDVVDVTDDGKDNIVISTIDGDIRIYEYQQDNDSISEICRTQDLPPVATMAIGDVTGDEIPDFVLGGMDNQVRTVIFVDGQLEVKATTPVGSLPTAICALNVVDDEAAEVIVATTDKTLRCYGWYDTLLDKLAHKVIEHPVFSIRPLRTEGMPYSRFVFGDDSGHLFVYQYQDDRLHERAKVKVSGEVTLVGTGSLTRNRTDEIITVSNARTLTLLGVVQNDLEIFDKIRAPGNVTSVRIGSIGKGESAEPLIISAQGNSKVTLLSFIGNRLDEHVSVKTAKKSVESLIAFGDLTGTKEYQLVQAVGTNLKIITLTNA